MPNAIDQSYRYHSYGGHGIDFKISDTDDSADTKYFGYVDEHGGWLIMKEVTSAGTFRYAMGRSSYTTNWTNRAGLTYSYYYSLFV